MAGGMKAETRRADEIPSRAHAGWLLYPWPFAKQSAGYPHLYVGGKLVLASRFVCASAHGDAPEGAQNVVRHHKCGNMAGQGCFNADCLEWGTPKPKH